MKIIAHSELSEASRYQAIEVLPSGQKIIVFAPTREQAIAEATKQVMCSHVFRVSRASRFKRCFKCHLIIKDN